MSGVVDVYLVAGGKYHDIDFARVELLKLLGEHENVRTKVSNDYSDVDGIAASDFLLTYTCDVRPTPDEEKALRDFVQGGKKWFALHGTNAILEFVANGVDTPRIAQTYVEVLGSQFIGHPPIAPYTVTVSNASHPLVAGIEPFETNDELYLCEYHGELEPLLETRFTGKATGFIEEDWPDDEPRLVMYLHPYGSGQVLYLTLGHCRGKYDMRPVMDEYPVIERGSWEIPAFYELVRRGLRWGIE